MKKYLIILFAMVCGFAMCQDADKPRFQRIETQPERPPEWTTMSFYLDGLETKDGNYLFVCISPLSDSLAIAQYYAQQSCVFEISLGIDATAKDDDDKDNYSNNSYNFDTVINNINFEEQYIETFVDAGDKKGNGKGKLLYRISILASIPKDTFDKWVKDTKKNNLKK